MSEPIIKSEVIQPIVQGKGDEKNHVSGLTPEQLAQLKILGEQFPGKTIAELLEILNSGGGILKFGSTESSPANKDVSDGGLSTTLRNPLPEGEQSSETKTETKTIASSINNSKSGIDYDLASYEKLSEAEMMKRFTEEYAKNKFMHSSKPPKTLEEWNAQDRTKEIQTAKKEIDTKGAKVIARLALEDSDQNMDTKNAIATAMLALQVANSSETALKDLKKLPAGELQEMFHNFLSTRQQKGVSSKSEENLVKTSTSISTAKKEALVSAGIITEDSNLTYKELDKLCAENKINIGVAVKEHLNHKIQNGESLTDVEKIIHEKIKDFPVEKYPGLFSRFGETSKLKQMLNSDEELAAKLAEAKTPKEKQQIRMEFLRQKLTDPKTGEINEELYMELFNDAVECGSAFLDKSPAMKAFLEIGNKNTQSQIVNKKDIASLLLIADNVNSFNRENKELISQNSVGLEDSDPDVANILVQQLGKNTEDKDKDIVLIPATMAKSAKIRRTATDAGMKIENKQGLTNFVKAVKSEAVKRNDNSELNHMVANLDEVHETNRLTTLEISTEGSAEVTQTAVKTHALSKLAAKDQVEGYKTLQNRIENEKLFTDKEAIECGKQLAAQIKDCDKSNQLEMHNLTLQSKYTEVSEFAVQNISSYDESVQAQALQSSLNYADKTGNTKLKDIACEQVSKLSKYAQNQISSNPELSSHVRAEMLAYEARHPEVSAEFYGQYAQDEHAIRNPKKISETTSEQNNDQTEKAEKIEKYKEEFKNASVAKKFRLIRKLQPEYQTKFFDYISTYAPGLFTSLLQAKGVDIFKLGLSMDAKNKAMREMLNNVDMRREALKFYEKYPSQFGDSIKRIVEGFEETNISPALQEEELELSTPKKDKLKRELENPETVRMFLA